MRKQFDFYGYNSAWDGKYFVNGNAYFMGEDYRSVKRFKEYKNVGFNMALIQHRNTYNGGDWETSDAKLCLDKAYKAGIDRVIISDKRLKDLCEEKLLVGEYGKFKSESEFVAYLKECVAPYRNHPAFYAVQLFDEPAWYKLKEYAKVHKALNQIGINAQSNLLNLCAPSMLAEKPTDPIKDYEDYLNYFAENSGIDYLMTDEYPFRGDNDVSSYTLPTYLTLVKVCKERGIELRMVFQSFSQEGCVAEGNMLEGGLHWRRMTEQDMYWQLNLGMGFGCKEYSFFTYYTKESKRFRETNRSVSDGIDGAAFINYDGTRSKLYYYTKKIISEIKKFESVLLNYNFNDAYFFLPKGKSASDFEVTKRVTAKTDCTIKVETKKDPFMVTELISKSGGKLYMVQNIGNPMNEILFKHRVAEVEIDLGKYADSITVYYKGEKVEKNIVNGKLIEKLHAGEALFFECK